MGEDISGSPVLAQDLDAYWAEARTAIVEETPFTGLSARCSSMWSLVVATSTRYVAHGHSLAEVKMDVETLWFNYCWTAMHTDENSASEQQSLVLFLDQVKRQRILQPAREQEMATANPTAATAAVPPSSAPQLWVDMPFFNTEVQRMLQAAFDRQLEPLQHSLQPWSNLNGLAMRVSTAGVYNLQVCAVLAFRQVLEDPGQEVLPIMLDVLLRWLQRQELWFEYVAARASSDATYSIEDHVPVAVADREACEVEPGTLAVDAGVHETAVNAARLQFWRTRVEDIVRNNEHDAAPHGLVSIAQNVLERLSRL